MSFPFPIYNPGGGVAENEGPNFVEGDFEVTGNTTLDGDLLVKGNERVNGNLTVVGTINGGGGGGGGTVVTTTTLNNGTLPGSFTTLNSSGATNLATGGAPTTVGGTLRVGGSTITGSTGATAITLPATSGTLALAPTSGVYVTTTTLDNDTLPASFTTLNSSGNTFLASTSGTTLRTNMNVLDDGAGTIRCTTLVASGDVDGNVARITAGLLFSGAGAFIAFPAGNNPSNQVNLLAPTETGAGGTNLNIPDLAGVTSTIVVNTTLNNSTLPGSFTTLHSTGATTLPSNTVVGNSTLTGSATATTIQLPATSGTVALTSQITPVLRSFMGSYVSDAAGLISWNTVYANGITVSGPTITMPAGNYSIQSFVNGNVAATTQYTLVNTVTGFTTTNSVNGAGESSTATFYSLSALTTCVGSGAMTLQVKATNMTITNGAGVTIIQYP